MISSPMFSADVYVSEQKRSKAGPQPILSVHPRQNLGEKAIIIVKNVSDGIIPFKASLTLSYKAENTGVFSIGL